MHHDSRLSLSPDADDVDLLDACRGANLEGSSARNAPRILPLDCVDVGSGGGAEEEGGFLLAGGGEFDLMGLLSACIASSKPTWGLTKGSGGAEAEATLRVAPT